MHGRRLAAFYRTSVLLVRKQRRPSQRRFPETISFPYTFLIVPIALEPPLCTPPSRSYRATTANLLVREPQGRSISAVCLLSYTLGQISAEYFAVASTVAGQSVELLCWQFARSSRRHQDNVATGSIDRFFCLSVKGWTNFTCLILLPAHRSSSTLTVGAKSGRS